MGVIAICELCIWALNRAIVIQKFNIFDLGGTTTIHIFASLFGLGCSLAITDRKKKLPKSEKN